MKQIDILPYHTKGISKWKSLGFEYELKDLKEPTKDEIYVAHDILKTAYIYKK